MFETLLEPNKELKNDINREQNFDKLISLIKNENLQILQESYVPENYILITFDNNEMENIKLSSSLMNEKDKTNELIKNYMTLQKNYIELKKEKKKELSQCLINNIDEKEYNKDIKKSSNSDGFDNDDEIGFNNNAYNRDNINNDDIN